MPAFERVTRLPGVDPARAWRVLGASFPRLVPPWETLEILGSPASIRVGEIASFRQPVGPLRIPWSSTITEVEPGVGFVDVASRSPFRAWRHEHAVQDGGGAILGDRVVWEARPGLGALDGWVRSRMELLFAWRHRVLREDLALPDWPPLRVAVTGGTGLVGRELITALRAGGHAVSLLSRRATGPGEIAWDPARGPDPRDLAGFDAVVHLAGEPVAQRWTPAARDRIRRSRVEGTEGVARAVAMAGVPTLICASAVGFYGHRDGEVDEGDPPGTGALADTAVAWEAVADPARAAGARVAHLRIGTVLSGRGGALPPLARVFRTGLGGPLGDGAQGFAWVALDDLVSMIVVALGDARWRGPINAVSPEPVSHGAFCAELARVLARPCALRVPAPAVRLMFGDMGDELLLRGARVRATRLSQLGFTWRRPGLDDALRVELGRPPIDRGG